MEKLTLKLKPSRQKIRIIANPDLIQFELNELKLEKKRFELSKELEGESFADRKKRELSDRIKSIQEQPEKKEEAEPEILPPPEYFQKINFSNYGEPVQISLDKILEDSIPIDIAAQEIQKAYENGLHDGQITARATYKTEIQKYREWINRIDSVVENLVDNHKSEIKDMQSSLIELSTMIAENIILEELKRDNNKVLGIVEEAIKGLETEKVFSIFLHPEDIDIVKSARGQLLKDLPNNLNISIIPDSTLSHGSVVLETTAGLVDARVKSKLEEIKINLLKEDDKLQDNTDIEEELTALYKQQMAESKNKEELSEGKIQLERMKIEDPELYRELVEQGEIEDEDYRSEITDTVKKIQAEEHKKKTIEEYGDDMDWDEDRLEEFDKRIESDEKGDSNDDNDSEEEKE